MQTPRESTLSQSQSSTMMMMMQLGNFDGAGAAAGGGRSSSFITPTKISGGGGAGGGGAAFLNPNDDSFSSQGGGSTPPHMNAAFLSLSQQQQFNNSTTSTHIISNSQKQQQRRAPPQPTGASPLFAPGSPAVLRTPTGGGGGGLLLGANHLLAINSGGPLMMGGGGGGGSTAHRSNTNTASSTGSRRSSNISGAEADRFIVGPAVSGDRINAGGGASSNRGRGLTASGGGGGLDATRFQLFSGTPRTYQRGNTRSKSPEENERNDEPYARLLAKSLLCGEDSSSFGGDNTTNNNNNGGGNSNTRMMMAMTTNLGSPSVLSTTSGNSTNSPFGANLFGVAAVGGGTPIRNNINPNINHSLFGEQGTPTNHNYNNNNNNNTFVDPYPSQQQQPDFVQSLLENVDPFSLPLSAAPPQRSIFAGLNPPLPSFGFSGGGSASSIQPLGMHFQQQPQLQQSTLVDGGGFAVPSSSSHSSMPPSLSQGTTGTTASARNSFVGAGALASHSAPARLSSGASLPPLFRSSFGPTAGGGSPAAAAAAAAAAVNSGGVVSNTAGSARMSFQSSQRPSSHTVNNNNNNNNDSDTSGIEYYNNNNNNNNNSSSQQEDSASDAQNTSNNNTAGGGEYGDDDEDSSSSMMMTMGNSYSNRQAESEKFSWTLSSTYNANRARNFKSRAFRVIPQTPERILDAPELLDDFYLHLLDWGAQNVLAVALASTLYLWNADTGEITQLMSAPGANENGGGRNVNNAEEVNYITSVSWHPGGHQIAVGLHNSEVQLWDTRAQQCIKTYTGHTGRVGCLAWNSGLLASGGRDATIRIHDTRCNSNSAVNTVHRGHTQEVCGLAWSPCGRRLASGGNDNVVNVWDFPMRHASVEDGRPLMQIRRHVAAVKALAWNPVKRGLLATGGGTADKTMCFWDIDAPMMSSSATTALARDGAGGTAPGGVTHTNNGAAAAAAAAVPSATLSNLLPPGASLSNGPGGSNNSAVARFSLIQTTPIHCVDTHSQICGLLWNKEGTELVTSHGYSQFELAVWKYPSLRRIADLTGHAQRVLHLSMSPDGETVVSAAADETIRFWKIYSQQQQQQQQQHNVGASATDTTATSTASSGGGGTPNSNNGSRRSAGGSRRGDVGAEELDLSARNDGVDWDLCLR